jgi:hypothetical protein
MLLQAEENLLFFRGLGLRRKKGAKKKKMEGGIGGNVQQEEDWVTIGVL